jgi:hypothetical protein
VLFSVGVKLVLVFSEEHRLQMLKNSVLGKIFGTKEEKVTGEWRRISNEKLNDFCPHQIL